MSPSLYLSVVLSSSNTETLYNAPDVRPLTSSPGKNPVVVVPIPTLPFVSTIKAPSLPLVSNLIFSTLVPFPNIKVSVLFCYKKYDELTQDVEYKKFIKEKDNLSSINLELELGKCFLGYIVGGFTSLFGLSGHYLINRRRKNQIEKFE